MNWNRAKQRKKIKKSQKKKTQKIQKHKYLHTYQYPIKRTSNIIQICGPHRSAPGPLCVFCSCQLSTTPECMNKQVSDPSACFWDCCCIAKFNYNVIVFDSFFCILLCHFLFIIFLSQKFVVSKEIKKCIGLIGRGEREECGEKEEGEPVIRIYFMRIESIFNKR